MVILGINGVRGIFHDASASLLVDGKIVASVEEERFNRRKHSNGIPFQAIEFCLSKAGLRFSDVDHIGFYLQPEVLRQTCLTEIVARFHCEEAPLRYIDEASRNAQAVESELRERFESRPETEFHFLPHHITHAACAYYTSGFQRAAILTIDGSGDRETSALFVGHPGGLEKVHEFLVYPESLGIFYTVFAAHLGLSWIAGPGKLMGLAGYGRADPGLFDDVIRLREDPIRPIEIDLSHFEYHLGTSSLSAKGRAEFGEALPEGARLDQGHRDLAASVQLALERAVLHLVRQVAHFLPAENDLCFGGGVALNVTTNRKILNSGLCRRLFVSPAAYDGGTSLGCALYLDAKLTGRAQYCFDVYSGPDVQTDYNIEAACRAFGALVEWECLAESDLLERAVSALVEERFVGWVQGRMESGPRALGNRSILGNPTSTSTKDRLNAGIKKREGFRPYAPSVCKEACSVWFDLEESPHMLLEAHVPEGLRERIPAVVHVDGTSRPQTVTADSNPRLYELLRRFGERTGVPMVLNTSFNQHGEPLVNRPEEAIAVLVGTTLDDLFIGNYHVRRKPGVAQYLEWLSLGERGFWKGREIAGAFELRDPLAMNSAAIETSGAVKIATMAEQWSYAAGFRLNSTAAASARDCEALVARIEMTPKSGVIGILFVLDDFRTVVGTPLACRPEIDRAVFDLILEPPPATGYLVIRNDASGGICSTCTVSSVRLFRASRECLP